MKQRHQHRRQKLEQARARDETKTRWVGGPTSVRSCVVSAEFSFELCSIVALIFIRVRMPMQPAGRAAGVYHGNGLTAEGEGIRMITISFVLCNVRTACQNRTQKNTRQNQKKSFSLEVLGYMENAPIEVQTPGTGRY